MLHVTNVESLGFNLFLRIRINQSRPLPPSSIRFSCPACEEIAKKVCKTLTDETDRMKAFEAVHQLTSVNGEEKDQAVLTLQKLGLLESVTAEVKKKLTELSR